MVIKYNSFLFSVADSFNKAIFKLNYKGEFFFCYTYNKKHVSHRNKHAFYNKSEAFRISFFLYSRRNIYNFF